MRFILMNFLAACLVSSLPGLGFAQPEEASIPSPWTPVERSIFDNQSEPILFYPTTDSLCNYDEDKGTFCFEIARKDSCYYVWVFYSVIEGLDMTFSPENPPFLRVDKKRQADLTTFFEIEKALGNDEVAAIVNEKLSFWIVQVGNPKDIRDNIHGFFRQMMEGTKLNIFLGLENDEYYHTRILITGVKTHMEKMLAQAFQNSLSHGECKPNL